MLKLIFLYKCSLQMASGDKGAHPACRAGERQKGRTQDSAVVFFLRHLTALNTQGPWLFLLQRQVSRPLCLPSLPQMVSPRTAISGPPPILPLSSLLPFPSLQQNVSFSQNLGPGTTGVINLGWTSLAVNVSRKWGRGTSLVVQWPRFFTPKVGDQGSVPG